MVTKQSPVKTWLCVTFYAVVGLIVGGLIGLALPRFPNPRLSRQEFPLPHHIARYPDNLTFRFAMAHDVLHERFPRHGNEYYLARNRLVQDALQKPAANDGPGMERYFSLVDDLAVGLCLTGDHARAVALMRDKLKRQETLGRRGRELYSTYANLGTFLILWQFQVGLSGDPDAKGRILESIDWIRGSSRFSVGKDRGRRNGSRWLDDTPRGCGSHERCT